MGGGRSRNQKTTYRQAQLQAEASEKARRAAAVRRRLAMVGLGICGVILAGVLVARGDDGDDAAERALQEFRSTTTELPNVSGKPCVPVADELPPAAPAVAVQVGAPPRALITEDLRLGDGDEVVSGGSVTMHYIGVACSTGKIVDSTYGGEPATFSLRTVIGGWQRGIPGMKVGGQRLLGFPPSLGYGRAGEAPHIARNESLWYVVEVLSTTAP